MIGAYCPGKLYEVTREDLDKLDIINIAFGSVRDGLLYYADRENTAKFVADWHAYKPELRVVLSIGGWTAGGFSTMCSTPEGIRAFTETCMTAIDDMTLDGIDLDWEYPAYDWAGIDASPDDRVNFTALLKSLREAMDARYSEHKLLTIAVCGYLLEGSMEYEKINQYLDYVGLMTYDLEGGPVAAHHTALNPTTVTKRSVKTAVAEYTKAGIPKEKLLAGSAFYCRQWETIPCDAEHPDGLGAVVQDKKIVGHNGWSYDMVLRDCLDENNDPKDGWIKGRDNGAPYLYHPEKQIFLSYDDEESVRAKIRYTKEVGLAGVMYWEHKCDHSRRLLTAMWMEEQGL